MSPLLALGLVMALLLVLGVPIAVALGLSTALGVYLSDLPLVFYTQRAYTLFDSFPLLAVPFFLLAGEIMQRGTLSDNLLKMCSAFAGHLKGGLAHISILTCLFYGSMCGAAPPTIAAVGGTMIPAMVKEGYPRDFSSAVNTAAGTLGPLIPPSVGLILFGAFGNVPITDLFIAVIVPGCLLALAFMIVAAIVVGRHGYGQIHPRQGWAARARATWGAKWALGVPVIILGGIYCGIVTPTEAGVCAVFYAIFVELCVTRNLTWSIFKKSLHCTLKTMGIIYFVMICANCMGTLLQYHRIETTLIEWSQAMFSTSYTFTAFLLVALLILGTFMDSGVMILIFTPLLVPVIKTYGMDPVHFGIWFFATCTVGTLTPPVGVNLYVGCSIGKVDIITLCRRIWPFLIAMTIVCIITAYVPILSLCLI